MKKDSHTAAFMWDLQNFEEQLFWGTSVNDSF